MISSMRPLLNMQQTLVLLEKTILKIHELGIPYNQKEMETNAPHHNHQVKGIGTRWKLQALSYFHKNIAQTANS